MESYEDQEDGYEDLNDEEDEEESGDEDSEPEENAVDEQLQLTRNDLSKMSMSDMLKIKDKIGKAAFYELLTGKSGSDATPDKRRLRRKQDFKRENKNRPREMSSKRPVRDQPSHSKQADKPEHWDPRFDPSAGEFRHDIFTKRYEFLNEVRQKEIAELKKKLRKAKTEERRSQIEYLLNRALNQSRAEQGKTEAQSHQQRFKNKVRTETGDRFVNHTAVKKNELVQKFKALKQSGKLEKYMEKKRKKNATRDRKRLNV